MPLISHKKAQMSFDSADDAQVKVNHVAAGAILFELTSKGANVKGSRVVKDCLSVVTQSIMKYNL